MTTVNITEGPSKLDLMLALFVDRNERTGREVDFATEIGHFYAEIKSCEVIDDGIGEPYSESWKIKGKGKPASSWNIKKYVCEFEATYSSKRRSGSFTVFE